MEWQLPVQKLEISNVNIGNPWSSSRIQSKPMAPLSYFGTQFRLPFVSVLFPPLPIVEYNPATGRLVLDTSETNLASIKLNTLQETLTNAIVYHQHAWFKTEFTKEEVRQGFQPIYNDYRLILHCPVSRGTSRPVPVYRNGTWGQSVRPTSPLAGQSVRPTSPLAGQSASQENTETDLQPGKRIRCAVKIHGISFLLGADGAWAGRCRIQHRIQGIIM